MSRFKSNKDNIRKQLAERVGVAAEYEGFQDSKAESTDIYDAHREWGTLKPLKEVKDTIENHNQEGFFSEAHNQMREIDTALDDYVDKLARNAELGNVDTTKVKGPTFDRLARIFENANKDKLVVKKWPSAWL